MDGGAPASDMRERLDEVPSRPGIYKFKNGRDQTIYVGKAADLSDRLRSYFQAGSDLQFKTRVMLEEAADFEYLVTDSERQALILEADFVKQFQPKFNVRLKDDKSFPFLRLTVQEPFPRMELTREVEEDGALYFGPFVSVGKLRETMDFIGKTFQIRTCDLEIDEDHQYDRPCLDHDLGRCPAPCVGNVSEEEYGELVDEMISFLRGDRSDVVRELREQMQEASEEREFERAARLRDVLQAIEETVDNVESTHSFDEPVDAVGYSYSEDEALVMVLPVRGGRYMGERAMRLDVSLDESPEELLEAFIELYYSDPSKLPRRILLPEELDNAEIIADWLSDLRGRRVYLHRPRRGPKYELVQRAQENARERMQTVKGRSERAESVYSPGQVRLMEVLDMDEPPRRIEGYDISNLRGKKAVGSMVVFVDGKEDSSEYRSFNVRRKASPDDFGMLAEVLRRRFERLCTDPDWEREVDLIMLDGGAGQLSTARRVVGELARKGGEFRRKLPAIRLCALAKKEEVISYYPPGSDELKEVHLDRTDAALRLLQQVRDEAHRFAKKRHTKRRDKSKKHSLLDDIDGIGPKRRNALLKEFGSVAKIEKASVDELAALDPMTRPAAENLKEQLESIKQEKVEEKTGYSYELEPME